MFKFTPVLYSGYYFTFYALHVMCNGFFPWSSFRKTMQKIIKTEIRNDQFIIQGNTTQVVPVRFGLCCIVCTIYYFEIEARKDGW